MQWTVGKRVWALAVSLVFILAVIFALTYFGIDDLGRTALAQIQKSKEAPSRYVEAVHKNSIESVSHLRGWLIENDPAHRKMRKEVWDDLKKNWSLAKLRIRPHWDKEEFALLLEESGRLVQVFYEIQNEIESAGKGAARVGPVVAMLTQSLGRLGRIFQRLEIGDQAIIGHRVRFVKNISVLLLAAGLFLALVMAYLVVRGLVRVLRYNAEELDSLSMQIAAAAAQLSASSASFSKGATEQANSLEETSTSLEEISAMSQENANLATGGKQTMDEMMMAMSEIDSSSQKINTIIKTIDGIAFQTNLLALNAAVEAARAGEHGKGFAVVADEVRNLAQRSASAAKDTAGLIEENVEKSKRGAELAGKCGDALANILNGSKEVATGVEQISSAVIQMDQTTQSNASSAEKTAASSGKLNSHADSMERAVSVLLGLVGAGAGEGGEDERAPAPPRRSLLPWRRSAKKKKDRAREEGKTRKKRPEREPVADWAEAEMPVNGGAVPQAAGRVSSGAGKEEDFSMF
ncbi:MAG: methyl-accepting chemotaxis protein [bacterium]|nr:methyl-accepting chemotaxis protein [bacterium]